VRRFFPATSDDDSLSLSVVLECPAIASKSPSVGSEELNAIRNGDEKADLPALHFEDGRAV